MPIRSASVWPIIRPVVGDHHELARFPEQRGARQQLAGLVVPFRHGRKAAQPRRRGAHEIAEEAAGVGVERLVRVAQPNLVVGFEKAPEPQRERIGLAEQTRNFRRLALDHRPKIAGGRRQIFPVRRIVEPPARIPSARLGQFRRHRADCPLQLLAQRIGGGPLIGWARRGVQHEPLAVIVDDPAAASRVRFCPLDDRGMLLGFRRLKHAA
jgi:hypothetical protein